MLVHLHRREGVKQTELAAILEIEKPTLGRLIDRLQEKGWVERRIDESDQRARRLVITDSVRPLIEQMEALAESVHDEALAGLDNDAETQLREALLAVKANLLGDLTNGNSGGES